MNKFAYFSRNLKFLLSESLILILWLSLLLSTLNLFILPLFFCIIIFLTFTIWNSILLVISFPSFIWRSSTLGWNIWFSWLIKFRISLIRTQSFLNILFGSLDWLIHFLPFLFRCICQFLLESRIVLFFLIHFCDNCIFLGLCLLLNLSFSILL